MMKPISAEDLLIYMNDSREKRMKLLNREYSLLPKNSPDWRLSRNFVPGEGPLDASVMLIGQAPGRKEDITGRPFIGASGKLLDRLIELAGLERKEVYIASTVQFFPPDNRMPTDREIGLCKGFLLGQISIIRPKAIVLMGSVACRAILGIGGISKERGNIVKRDGISYMLSLHPAAAVRIRSRMPVMEADFVKFGKSIRKL